MYVCMHVSPLFKALFGFGVAMAFVTRITGVVGATADDLSVTIRSQSGDGRALAELSAKHPFEEEIVLPVAAPAPVAIVIEVRGGGDVPIGFHALPWSDVSQRTCKGWALDEQLRLPSGEKSGARIVARLMYVDAQSAARHLEGVRQALAQTKGRNAGVEEALAAQTAEQVGRLRKARFQLQQRHASAARARTEREVASFREQLEERLHAARRGRERAMADFNRRQERAVSEHMPRVAARFARAAEQQRAAIALEEARAREREAGNLRHHLAAVEATLPAECASALGRVDEQSASTRERLARAFVGGCNGERSTLRRALERIEREVRAEGEKEVEQLLAQAKEAAAAHAEARAELERDAAGAAEATREDASVLVDEWLARLSSHQQHARAQLARSLAEQHAERREWRASRRVADGASQQEQRALLRNREDAVATRRAHLAKEHVIAKEWLSRRADGAIAAAAARAAGAVCKDSTGARAVGAVAVEAGSSSHAPRWANGEGDMERVRARAEFAAMLADLRARRHTQATATAATAAKLARGDAKVDTSEQISAALHDVHTHCR